ncbi:type I glyceraldehyde-3-phosphate dehydrogenase [Candidatus Collierbacteria bacterium]|nr:type I glyceraldehyde-3-phosphate dehydrogenase [Candidatus Collierbacteria bacterium]
MPNFVINGFGRIGRSACRVWLKSHTDKLNLVAINTSGSMPASSWAQLLKLDTAYGPLPYKIEAEDTQDPKGATDDNPVIGSLSITTDKSRFHIPLLAQRQPTKLPWTKLGVDVVIESTGAFLTRDLAGQHLLAGAKTVVLSAPPKDDSISTSVISVNDGQLTSKDRRDTITIISNASCTTNCVTPVAAVMHSKIGIRKAMLLTVHGYTDDQNLQDNSHKDLRRARAAAANIVPTTTGAAISATEAIPHLKGLFDGVALRVPVITGSITDFTFITNRSTSVEEVNEMFIEATHSPLYRHVLATSTDPLVSSDIIGRPESAIVDLPFTRVVDGDMVKILAWYDNEYGYANRLIEQVVSLTELL